ncbi:MAG: UvrD-helicase domain-containing protein [Candidatus Pacebacteria bacterium]|nr:UvrD-helicase domain-containing protein [Candidatus Paceibacterota bacterium]
MADILENLNEKQKEAVLTTEGPVLVIAGPGSGKTRVLTHRIVHIIASEKTKPENILAVTFTNKAAQEMKNRAVALLDRIYSSSDKEMKDRKNLDSYSVSFALNFPTICTFHSLCVKILRKEAEIIGYKKDFIIFDGDDQKTLVKKVMKELQMNDEQSNPKAVLAEISNAKNELKTPQEYENIVEGFFQENVSKIYNLYQKELKESNSFDFDDLIMQTAALFLNHPKVLEKYQQKFKYIMADEYQDTNYAQYRLINLLSKKHKNIFVVGDDWQSIYKWRGADIKNILDFEKNYLGAKTILLEQNYRSTQEILDVSYGIISKNINRKEKKLFSSKGAGERIVVYEAANEKGEAEFIVSEIAKLNTQKNIKLKNIAVLYRTNAQSRSIEEAFLQYNVPYRIVGGIKFYMRKEIKNIIAYFRFIQNPNDFLSFERIINIPKRGIGKTTFEKVINVAKKERIGAVDAIINYDHKNITKKRMESLVEFTNIVKRCRKKMSEVKISQFLDFLLKAIDYKEYILDGTEEGEGRWENVQELFSAIEKYDKFSTEEAVKLFLEEVALATDLDNVDDDQETVTLMTLHSAKGLEYDTIFIIGLEEGLLPHSMSMENPAEMEEERRLCYVGITRAKNKVHLIFARVRRIFGSTQANYPSRFISDIPEHLVEHKYQGYSYLREEEDCVEVD